MNRVRLKLRFPRRCLHELRRIWQIEVDQLPAIIADGVIVTIEFAVVAAGAVAKSYLVNQACVLQVTQRVVNGCVADAGETLPGRLKYVAGGRMVVSFLYDLVHRFSLRRELSCLFCFHQKEFRLILK